jgi:VanZ family protein
MNENTRPAWAWLFFVQLALIIIASVLATTNHLPLAAVLKHAPGDKIGHMLAYGGLAFFAVAFFGRARRWRVLAVLLVAAALEELSQRAFPTRTFDLGDLAMNAIGILMFGNVSLRGRLGPSRARSA